MSASVLCDTEKTFYPICLTSSRNVATPGKPSPDLAPTPRPNKRPNFTDLRGRGALTNSMLRFDSQAVLGGDPYIWASFKDPRGALYFSEGALYLGGVAYG